LKTLVLLLCLVPGVLVAQQPTVTSLLSKDLTELHGKEGVLLEVDYPPGGSDPIHRHNADVFVYVLEGTVVMQVQGGEPVTLKPGQTFYEGPNDVHTIARNASKTKSAKFLALFIKEKSAPILTPAK
jgi:quercetin dioxygenase-like cupin family protein